jgi:hypothetical protein
MATLTETLRAGSRSDAIEQALSLYPDVTAVDVLSRRNDSGQFSAHGHNFIVKITFEEPDEELGDRGELGDEEY